MEFGFSRSAITPQGEPFYTSATSVSPVGRISSDSGAVACVHPTPRIPVHKDHNAVWAVSDLGNSIAYPSTFVNTIDSQSEIWRSVHASEDLRSRIMRAREIEANGQVAQALDIVFREVDRRLREGEFGECEEFLNAADIASLSTRMIMGLLSITFAASRELPARRRFFIAARKQLRLRGKDPERLIGGLRGGRAANGDANPLASKNAR
jgi:hypothetical protein